MRCLCLKGGGVEVEKGGINSMQRYLITKQPVAPNFTLFLTTTEPHRNTSMFKSHCIAHTPVVRKRKFEF